MTKHYVISGGRRITVLAISPGGRIIPRKLPGFAADHNIVASMMHAANFKTPTGMLSADAIECITGEAVSVIKNQSNV